VADALVSEHRPAALAAIDEGANEIAMPVEVQEIYTVTWPASVGRLHYRADLTQSVRLRQNIRS
jgi:hypothetical protein